ncbi:hypothetical protein NC796_26205 [Aliifodinibius sp. S!AR15-10]|nr:hypothetical protein [Aliifodinibius sp. S!AR15-10]
MKNEWTCSIAFHISKEITIAYINMFKTYSYFSCLLLCFVLSCSAEKPSQEVVETTELKDYETLVGLESGQVALPVILKVREDQSFAVYDIVIVIATGFQNYIWYPNNRLL